MKRLLFIIILVLFSKCYAQVIHPAIGTTSTPKDSEIKLTLIAKIQGHTSKVSSDMEFYDKDIISPKSALFLEEKNKFYINSLEGFKTVVFDISSFKKIKSISHDFSKADEKLFIEETELGYKFFSKERDPKIFKGKPVEMCLSNGNKYLWVTYYRRSFDPNAIEPSAVAIIDTDIDKIVRVMPTGPLPKMIAASPDGKYVAITHWGDNTVGIIDVSSKNVNEFKYVKHLIVDYQQKFSSAQSASGVDRDKNCGLCLRGTDFTTDGKYLLVGRMGGGGISVFDMKDFSLKNTVLGMRTNVRHLVVTDNYLYLSSNRSGYVQKTSIDKFIDFALIPENKGKMYNDWQECFAGIGARTIEVSDDEKYIFVACNNFNGIVVVRASDMKKVAEIKADSFPVGLALRRGNFLLISTSQAHPGVGGGNSVNIFYVKY